MSSRLVSLTDMPLDHMLDRGWPKTLKDSTLNFLMPHRIIFELTKQRLLLLIWSQLVIAFDNLLLGSYFGKRFRLKLLSDWWHYFCDWLVENILVRDFGWNYYQIGGIISVIDWWIIFWCEILVAIIIKLMPIFMWVIGEEYFGKRFWLQLENS